MNRLLIPFAFFVLLLSSFAPLTAQVSNHYYYVGMNTPGPDSSAIGFHIFCPYGDSVHFDFVDNSGAHHLAARDFNTIPSQYFLLSSLAPGVPVGTPYYVEIYGQNDFAVHLKDQGSVLTPHRDLAYIQTIAKEGSNSSDDFFRLYSPITQTVTVLDENLTWAGSYALTGGIPAVFPVPSLGFTSWVLMVPASGLPIAASWHDNPQTTSVLQYVNPNAF